MRLETIPLIVGGALALVGVLLLLDAWLPDYVLVKRERRRRPRRDRDRTGEFLIGLGLLGMAGAFLGLDTWRYRILATLLGAAFLLIGLLKNRAYLGELLRFRGPSRRANPPIDRGDPPAPSAPPGTSTTKDRTRIR